MKLLFLILLTLCAYSQSYNDLTLSSTNKLQTKDFSGALQDASKAIELDPNQATAYIYKGLAQAELGQYQEAIINYNNGIEKLTDKKELEYVYIRRGIAKDKNGNYSEALEDFTRTIELNPNNSENYLIRGQLHMHYKNYSSAAQDFEKTLELNNQHPAILHLLIGTAKRENRDYQSALVHLNKVIELTASSAMAYFQRGLTQSELKNHSAAISDLSTYLSMNKNSGELPHTHVANALAFFHRANAKVSLKDYQGSIDDYTKAISFSSEDTNGPIYLKRGLAYISLSNNEKACADFKIGLEKKVPLSESYYKQYCNNSSDILF